MSDELHPDNNIRVEGVVTHEWIPFLNTWGPLNRCSLKVKDIVNLLNNDVNVILTEEKNKDLYLFVKKYNLYAEKFGKPKAERAEQVLYQRLYKEALRIEEEEDKLNPFTPDPEEDQELDEYINSSTIQSKPQTGMVSPLIGKQKQTVKRPRLYDMVKPTTSREKTPLQKMEDLKTEIEFGNIDFID